MEIPRGILMKYGGALANGLFNSCEGEAELSFAEKERCRVPVTLYVGPDSQAWLWFTAPCNHQAEKMFRNATAANSVAIAGRFSNGRTFCADKAMLVRSHQALPKSTFELLILSPLYVQSSAPKEAKMVVRYTLLNSLFSGTEMTQKTIGHATSSRRDRFGFRSTLFNWEAAWLDSIDQEHFEALRNGLVAVLPTATITVEIEPQVPPEQHDYEAESITRLLSLGSGVATRWAARQIFQEGRLIQEMFVRRILTTTAEDKSRYNLICNLDESNLQHFLTSCLTKYQEAETALCLNTVVTYLEQARHEKNPELKLAVLIMALETLSYHWCLHDGLSARQLESIHLQDKLLRMRKKKFHFIEKVIVSHTLRKGLRNPLIHSGQIPMMTTEEKVVWVNSLYTLSLRILLCELGYHGRYRDLTNGLALVSAPN